MDIRLTDDQLYECYHLADCRDDEARLAGLQDKHGLTRDKGYRSHLLGVCGEMAVKIALGDDQPLTLNTFKVGFDVAGLQVRTRSRHWYDLIVRDDDRTEDRFILVTSEHQEVYRIHGWIFGREAMHCHEWRRAYGGRETAWFVPQSALHSLGGEALWIFPNLETVLCAKRKITSTSLSPS